MTAPAVFAAGYEPLLLRAATATGEEVVRAWNRFLSAHALDEVADAEAQRLLATVYGGLRAAGAPDDTPELPRLAGIYRRTWALNQQVWALAVEAVDVLTAASIEAIVDPVTTTAMSVDPGLVEVGPALVLVAPDNAGRAASVLAAAGSEVTPAPQVAVSVRRRRTVTLPGGGTLFLASSLGRWMIDEAHPYRTWELLNLESCPVELGERRLRALGPSDALAALIAEGQSPASPLRLRWAVLAVELLATGAVDAHRLVELTRHLVLGPLLSDGLGWLSSHTAVAVDPDLMEPLAEFEAYRAALERARGLRGGPFPDLRSDLAVATRQLNAWPALGSVPSVVVDRWGLESAAELPAAVAQRALARFRGRGGKTPATQATAATRPTGAESRGAWPEPGIVSQCWPSPADTDLLHAALGPADRAGEAWDRARRQLGPDLMVHEQQRRLYPLVWKNLRQENPDHPDLALLQQAHRATLLRNLMTVQRVGQWLTVLEQAGIKVCLLKGLPLALTLYRDLGERPMADVDALIRVEDLANAVGVLEDNGWQWSAPGDDLSRLMDRTHALALVHPDLGEIDAHWFLNKFLIRADDPEGSADSFWARAQPLEVGGVAALALDSTDALAHTIVHGSWRGSGASFRWVPDALLLTRALAAEGGPDLARLVWIGERFQVGLMLHESLRYLVHEFDAPVPDSVIAALGRVRISAANRRRYRIATDGGAGPRLAPGFPTWRAFWAQDRWGRTPLQAARMFPEFVLSVTGIINPDDDARSLADRSRTRVADVARLTWRRARDRR